MLLRQILLCFSIIMIVFNLIELQTNATCYMSSCFLQTAVLRKIIQMLLQVLSRPLLHETLPLLSTGAARISTKWKFLVVALIMQGFVVFCNLFHFCCTSTFWDVRYVMQYSEVTFSENIFQTRYILLRIDLQFRKQSCKATFLHEWEYIFALSTLHKSLSEAATHARVHILAQRQAWCLFLLFSCGQLELCMMRGSVKLYCLSVLSLQEKTTLLPCWASAAPWPLCRAPSPWRASSPASVWSTSAPSRAPRSPPARSCRPTTTTEI